MITYGGKTQGVERWSAELGINPETLRWRLARGWSVEEAFSLVKRAPHWPGTTHNGKTQSLRAWTAEIGVSYPTLQGRLKSGWSLERALTPQAPGPNIGA